MSKKKSLNQLVTERNALISNKFQGYKLSKLLLKDIYEKDWRKLKKEYDKERTKIHNKYRKKIINLR